MVHKKIQKQYGVKVQEEKVRQTETKDLEDAQARKQTLAQADAKAKIERKRKAKTDIKAGIGEYCSGCNQLKSLQYNLGTFLICKICRATNTRVYQTSKAKVEKILADIVAEGKVYIITILREKAAYQLKEQVTKAGEAELTGRKKCALTAEEYISNK